MSKPLTSEQDAFGHAVWDHYHGTNAFEIIERSDGLFAISSGPYTLEVVGVDVSPLAIAVAKARGLKKAEVLSIDELPADLGTFDTILLLGNNFGLFGNAAKTRRLLRRFKAFARPGATLIVESLNVYDTKDPDHLAYQAANRERGRMSGQIRMRARYKRFVTPWFDYLMVSPEEMESLLDRTGWRIEKLYQVGPRFYTAIIERID